MTIHESKKEDKEQFNVYIPSAQRRYVDETSERLDISKSDFIWMLLDYSEIKFSFYDLLNMRRKMLVTGHAA